MCVFQMVDGKRLQLVGRSTENTGGCMWMHPPMASSRVQNQPNFARMRCKVRGANLCHSVNGASRLGLDREIGGRVGRPVDREGPSVMNA